ncbi:MAG: ABC transporter permease, partial [Saprospiraceae bacterium]
MWEIFKFELQYRSKRPATYLYFFIMFLLAFCAITTDVVQVGGSSGQVKVNAPTTIATFYIILSAIPGLLLASAIMGVPVLRDFQHHTASMIFTTPIKKWQYLGGRFLGSLFVTLFVFSGMFVGLSLGLLMPWIETEELLPYNTYHLIHPFLVFVIPNVLIMAGIFFASGALSKKIMVVYAQGIFLFVAYQLGLMLTRDVDNQALAALCDPFGITTVRYYTQYWTIMEKNTEVVPFMGIILQNRLLWLAISMAALVLTYFGFNFNIVKNAKKKLKKVAKSVLPNANNTAIQTAIPTA